MNLREWVDAILSWLGVVVVLTALGSIARMAL